VSAPFPRRRLTAAVAACLIALFPATLLSGCASAPPASPACHSPEAAVLPHTTGSLTQADTGTYCLAVGQTLDIFLTAPSGSSHIRWGQITIGDTSVLGYGNSGVLTPPVNVTPGVVVGLSRGTTTLSSALPSGKKWTATIVVS
jgi:hypothetical protein